VEPPKFTQVFSDAIMKEAADNSDIVAITAAMTGGTGLADFRRTYPERFYDVGIAEEHAVALAAGLALGGKVPVVAIYSTFLQRAFDQLLTDVALQKQHVVFCIDRAGLVGEDGSTHHGEFDLAYLRMVPGMRVLAPATASDLEASLATALRMDGPVAIRYSRGRVWSGDVGGNAASNATLDAKADAAMRGVTGIRGGANAATSAVLDGLDEFGDGVPRAQKLRDGDDVALLALGHMVPTALDAANILAANNINASVYNMLWAKPVDARAVMDACGTKLIVTLEDGVVSGGFGSGVLELVQDLGASGALGASSKPGTSGTSSALGVATASNARHIPQVLRLGLPDEFMLHGTIDELFHDAGLTPGQISQQVADRL
ncbi:MAG: hypothetical protein LBM21_01650, partial [Coriobacteriales bacterium]|nr:hypothetical protein [Coriobacteriales bacterium]